MKKNPKFQEAFRELGKDWDVKPQVQKQLEQFVCMMYGQSRENSVDRVRVKMLKKMIGDGNKLTSKSRVDLARLPPCRNALVPHIQRVNHRVSLYKRAHECIIESPKPYDEGQGWTKTDDGLLEPLWSRGPVLPQSLVDLLERTNEGNGDITEDESEDENESMLRLLVFSKL